MFLLRVVFAMALAGFSYTFWRISRSGRRGLCVQFSPASFATLHVATTRKVLLMSLRRMKSSLLREIVSGVSAFRKDNESFGKDAGRGVLPDESPVTRGNHVLIVGPMDSGNKVRSALLGESNLTISIVTNYLELWTIPNQEFIHLVILNKTLSTFELDASSRLVRQRWPRAKILVVHQGEGFLEDALYDDRVKVGDTPEVLRDRIGRLLIGRFDRSRQDAR